MSNDDLIWVSFLDKPIVFFMGLKASELLQDNLKTFQFEI